jgi:hypothetical protein
VRNNRNLLWMFLFEGYGRCVDLIRSDPSSGT